jgi:hypothetical protein
MVELEVDRNLGTIRLLKITAAHDVGKAINPMLVEGQIEGGVAQGVGFAVMEEFHPGCGENLHDYVIPSVGDIPPITVSLEGDRYRGECILIPPTNPPPGTQTGKFWTELMRFRSKAMPKLEGAFVFDAPF